MKKSIIVFATVLTIFQGCAPNDNLADAYGNFESDEVMVSSESSGKLINIDVKEGDEILSGEEVGLVDTTQLFLKKEQLKASIDAILSKVLPVNSQINVLS